MSQLKITQIIYTRSLVLHKIIYENAKKKTMNKNQKLKNRELTASIRVWQTHLRVLDYFPPLFTYGYV